MVYHISAFTSSKLLFVQEELIIKISAAYYMLYRARLTTSVTITTVFFV